MKSARAKRAKLLFFIVKYANFHRRRRRGSLTSLFFPGGEAGRVDVDMRVASQSPQSAPLFVSYLPQRASTCITTSSGFRVTIRFKY